MNVRILTALLIGGFAITAASCNQSSQGGSPGTRDSFTLKQPLTETTLKQGDRQTVKLTLSRDSDFKKSVTIEATEPAGLKVKAEKKVIAAGDPADFTLTIEADKSAPLGEQIIKVTGTPESGKATTMDLKVKVEQGPK